MERSLYITKFRNIGLEESERLLLNNSLEKDKLGNLVIVIGANNSGKSNVLEALKAFGNGKIAERDITTLSFDDADRKPQLGLTCKDGKDEYTYRITYGDPNPFIFIPKNEKEPKYAFADDAGELVRTLNNVRDTMVNYGAGDAMITDSVNGIIELANNNGDKNDIIRKCLGLLKCIDEKAKTNRNYKNGLDQLKRNYGNAALIHECFPSGNPLDDLKRKYSERYGYDFFPNIVEYKESKIGSLNLLCGYNELKSNPFMVAVFEKIGYPLSDVMNAYGNYQKLKNRGVLTTLSREVNKKLSALADDFNSLYSMNDVEYRFEMIFDPSQVAFQLFCGKSDINLDYQSEGFRWFFDLYFNLFCRNTMKLGDIIVMDEPATNLQIVGQVKLRSFLKDFAIRNGLTIVLATQYPYLIGMDYLDELRVVTTKDNVSSIHNDFAAIDPDDPDTLSEVKKALTVSNYALTDDDKKLIFVEGITDYNYLVMAKNILGNHDDLVFAPINGVGDIAGKDAKKKQKDISKKLISIRKHGPVLLVDGDQAGKAMKEANKEDSELTVISLSDIDQSFKTIESLFSEDDRKKMGIVDMDGNLIKHSSSSSLLKTFAGKEDLSSETKKNFEEVFKSLE